MAAVRRALILSTSRDRGALAGARALARSGWTVGVGTPDGGGVLGASRAVTCTHVVPRPRGDGLAFLEATQRAVAQEGYDLVLGGGDDWMAALSAYRDQVPAPVASPDFAAVRTGLDKVALGAVAAQVGLAAPHTEPATAEHLARWSGPLVLKSRSHWTPGATHVQRIDARVFAEPGRALDRIELIRASGGEAILQRPIDGDLGALIGLFHDGRLRGRVQQTTPRLWPTPHGMSARARTVPVDQDLCARAEHLLRRIGWRGLVELQFLTGADGVPHLIDLNGRFYGSLALADAACPGLVEAWALQSLAEPVPGLPDGRTGLRYAWSAGDLRRARAERRGSLAGDLAGTLRWGLRARHSVWAVRDPGPAWRLLRERRTPVEASLPGTPLAPQAATATSTATPITMS